jgi:hypothetical protein
MDEIASKNAVAKKGNAPPRKILAFDTSFEYLYIHVPAMLPIMPPMLPIVVMNPIVNPSDDFEDDPLAGDVTTRLRIDFRLGSKKQRHA